MKKMFCRIICAVLSIAIICSLAGCNRSKSEIEELMTEFELSCNTLDFDAVLNCITPKVSDNIKTAVNVLGMFTNRDTDYLFGKLAEILANNEEINGTDFFESIQIETEEIVIDEENEKKAQVSALVTYTLLDETMTKEAVFDCDYYAEKWYISSFSFN